MGLTRPRHHLTAARESWCARTSSFFVIHWLMERRGGGVTEEGMRELKAWGKLPKLHLPCQVVSLLGKWESTGDSFQALHLID